MSVELHNALQATDNSHHIPLAEVYKDIRDNCYILHYFKVLGYKIISLMASAS